MRPDVTPAVSQGMIKHNGKIFFETGKKGTDVKTGVAVVECEARDESGKKTGERIWVDSAGNVSED